jgi:thymidylate synthase (FAD)
MERRTELKVKLLTYTPEPEKVVATAMRQSRYRGGVINLTLKSEDFERLVNLALKLGHLSVFEHVSFTFAIEGISRACSHQFVRHRLFAFTQQSQRYVKEKEFPYIMPESVQKNEKARRIFDDMMNKISDAYDKLSALVPIEDARFVLPNATETKIVATANARELMHFFSLRMDEAAQWEIRNMAKAMFNEVQKVAPHIFKESNLKLFV